MARYSEEKILKWQNRKDIRKLESVLKNKKDSEMAILAARALGRLKKIAINPLIKALGQGLSDEVWIAAAEALCCLLPRPGKEQFLSPSA